MSEDRSLIGRSGHGSVRESAAARRALCESRFQEGEEPDGIHEECGVFGIRAPKDTDVAHITYCALTSLQHRGQESAGIAVNRERTIVCHKDLGLVHEVFSRQMLDELDEYNRPDKICGGAEAGEAGSAVSGGEAYATMAVGHVRYSTSGSVTRENAQPMVVRHVKGQLAICHNGNLVNSFALRRSLELQGCIFHSTSDTEVISYLITRKRLNCGAIEEAVSRTMNELEGAYSLVVMSPAKLIACRDPHGFRPLCIGTMEDGSVIFASESCALDAIGAKFVRDILPGEIVIADKNGVRTDRRHCSPALLAAAASSEAELTADTGAEEKMILSALEDAKGETAEETVLSTLEGMKQAPQKTSHCIFEYIYFARPDSVIDGVSVHDYRVGAGRELAIEHPADADLVIGVPDSGLDAATGFAEASGIPYALGLIKNKYIGRTFIAPSQQERTNLVRLKLNAIRSVIEGRRVVLIDDSIVRGTTSARIIQLVRDAGAKEVHMRISSPPFLNPCYYGTDIDSRENLIACHHTIPEIADIIGADSLGYLSVEAAKRLANMRVDGKEPEPGRDFCCACFNGDYPTAVPEVYSKDRMEL